MIQLRMICMTLSVANVKQIVLRKDANAIKMDFHAQNFAIALSAVTQMKRKWRKMRTTKMSILMLMNVPIMKMNKCDKIGIYSVYLFF